MSVERAEYVAVFDEERPFNFENAKQAVEKAGFTYQNAEIVARGRAERIVVEDGPATWILKDSEAGMVLRLAKAEGDSAFAKWVGSSKSEEQLKALLIRGTVDETPEASITAKRAGAQFTVRVTSFGPAALAGIPPLVPDKSEALEPEEGRH